MSYDKPHAETEKLHNIKLEGIAKKLGKIRLRTTCYAKQIGNKRCKPFKCKLIDRLKTKKKHAFLCAYLIFRL